ncbi:MAG: choice-of-anchor B family protein [Saprospiraceae bacterium]
MPCKYLTAFCCLFCLFAKSSAQGSWNVELLGLANRGDVRYSGSWSYTDASGKEYALIGAKTGTAIYNIDDANSLEELGFVPGPETNWREITTIGNYAYVVTDAQGTGHSLQVIDLGYLPDSLHLLTEYTATFTKGHIIQKAVDNDEPYIYVMGASPNEGVHILDVSDPGNPQEIGLYAPGYYIHDAHIRGNTMYAAAFYETIMDIVDISDKTNPVLLGKITYPGKNTHSCSTTENGKYLIMADEADGYPARVFNVENPTDVKEITSFTANPLSLVHNPYVRGKYCFVSHNTEGLRIMDIADPALPVEVGYFDTYPGPSGGFFGLWSACPYFPSGKIIGGDRTQGLYIWKFNNTLAARLYGTVVDSLTLAPLPAADIEIVELADTLKSDQQGLFKKGMLEGSYTVKVSLPGFAPKILVLDLAQGDSLAVQVPLVPDGFSLARSADNSLKTLSVYPNPSPGHLNLDWKELQGVERIDFLNAAGKTIFTKKVEGRFALQINDGVLPKGHFWAKAMDSQGITLATASISID